MAEVVLFRGLGVSSRRTMSSKFSDGSINLNFRILSSIPGLYALDENSNPLHK